MERRNYPYLRRMKSATEHHQRPTAALLEEPDPTANWTSHDYRLQEAIGILDRENCKTCGNPIWLCRSTDNRIDFEIQTGTCYADAVIKEYEEDKRNPELGSGEFHFAVPRGIENEDGEFDPLPSRREALETLN